MSKKEFTYKNIFNPEKNIHKLYMRFGVRNFFITILIGTTFMGGAILLNKHCNWYKYINTDTLHFIETILDEEVLKEEKEHTEEVLKEEKEHTEEVVDEEKEHTEEVVDEEKEHTGELMEEEKEHTGELCEYINTLESNEESNEIVV